MRFLLAHIGRRQVASLVIAMLCLATLDMLGVAVIFPYLQILTVDTPDPDQGWLSRLHDWTGATSRHHFIVMASIALITFFALRFALNYLASRAKYRINARVARSLSDDLFEGLLGADYTFLANRSVSEMTGVISSQTIHATLCLDAWANIATEALFLLLILAFITAIDIKLAALLVSALLFLTAVLYLVVIRRAARLGALQTQIHLRQYRFLYSIVSGLRDIKILGLERASEAEHRDLNARYAAAIASFNVHQTLPRGILELVVMVGVIGAAMAVVVGDYDLKTAVPIIGLLAVSAWRVVPSYTRIVSFYGVYNYYKRSLGVVEALFKELRAVQVRPRRAPHAFERNLEVRNLHFSHGDTTVLRDLSLEIPKGLSVGLVGLSGSGKTTLLDVIAGLRRPVRGTFLIDGDVFDPFEADTLRRLLGYVPQSVTLIDDTIAFNIAFSRQPDLPRLQEVVRAARVDEFTASLPAGLETQVGENGVRLSGGQKQRIGIARALYRQPELLILDEATSALDAITEREIVEEIGRLRGRVTTLMVTHRLASIAGCDRIYVLDSGRIVDSGRHLDLMERCEVYRDLAKVPEKGEIEQRAEARRER